MTMFNVLFGVYCSFVRPNHRGTLPRRSRTWVISHAGVVKNRSRAVNLVTAVSVSCSTPLTSLKLCENFFQRVLLTKVMFIGVSPRKGENEWLFLLSLITCSGEAAGGHFSL